MSIDYPVLYTIRQIVNEAHDVKSFYLVPFKDKEIKRPLPGNFIMLWIPLPKNKEIDYETPDSIPLSVSDYCDDLFVVTVKKKFNPRRKTTTQELFQYTVGDILGVVGPKGNSFSLRGNRILLIAGGIGIAPIRFLAKCIKQHKKDVVMVSILGFKSKNEVVLRKDMQKYCEKVYITTEDGTEGAKGTATDLLEDVVTTWDIDYIYSCGPELMMKKILNFSLEVGIPAEFSLERYMHCGSGVCGFCSLDGFLVCRDGPVIHSNRLKNMNEFGKTWINPTGKKEKI